MLWGLGVTNGSLIPRARSESGTNPAPYRVERLHSRKPVISRAHFTAAGVPEDGANINGPSVIRVPDWVAPNDRPHPEARYYLYFAHHGGTYIRLAWAREITGPYELYRPDRARRAASDAAARTGVLALPRVRGEHVLRFDNGTEVREHLASPDVHVDDRNRRFVLYFHGVTNTTTPPPHGVTGPQKTVVATSATGLNFNPPRAGGEEDHGPRAALLGNAYFRVFGHGEYLYAFSNGGRLWRARRDAAFDPAVPPTADSWEEGPNPIAEAVAGDPRHLAVRFVRPDRIEVFFSVRGSVDESIERTEIDLSAGGPTGNDWYAWRAEPPDHILAPEEEWEGSAYPAAVSRGGGQTGVRQLRDPAVYTDIDGSVYLFYCGAGEEGIGLARLVRVQRKGEEV